VIGRALRLEWGRFRARRETRAAALFLLLGTVGYGLLLRAVGGSGLPGAALVGAEPSGFHLAYKTARGIVPLLALFLLLWSAGSIASELESGTLRAPLLRLPRPAVALGKAALYVAAAAVLLGVIFALGLALGALTFGLHAVTADSIVLHTAGALLGSGLLGALLTLLPLASVVALGICASCLTRTAHAALTLALIVACVLWAATLLPVAERVVFPATLGRPLAVALSRAEGLKTESFRDGLLQHLLVNALWTAGLLGLGVARFRRRDLP
jgi:ABC-type transport system involved in multi-copper enzyme maturation permease subunit